MAEPKPAEKFTPPYIRSYSENRADTRAAVNLLGRLGRPYAEKVRNPGLKGSELRDTIAVLLVYLSAGSHLMMDDVRTYRENLLRTDVLLLSYAAIYIQLGGPRPRGSSVELLVGGQES